MLCTSLAAIQIVANSEGSIRGKEALHADGTNALRLIPDLRFEVEAVHAGVGARVIRYKYHEEVSVLLLRAGKVRVGCGTYPSDAPNPAAVGER